MNPIFIVAIGLALAAVIAWNFVPSIRERLRGWTTVAEAALAGALPFIGNLIDVFDDTNWEMFVPRDAWPYVIGSLAAWFFFKRLVTSTAVGTGR